MDELVLMGLIEDEDGEWVDDDAADEPPAAL